MKKIFSFKIQPADSIITKGLAGKIDYVDSFCVEIKDNKYSIDYLTAILFDSTYDIELIKLLINIRDFIVKPFGLVTGMPVRKRIESAIRYNIGDKAVFFNITDRSENEIVMCEDDRHLYFRTSLLVRNNVELNKRSVYLTTIVQFHNTFGRIYFSIIKYFHKFIMKMLLKKFNK